MLGRSIRVLGELNALDAMSLLGVHPLWTPGSGVGLRVQRKAQVPALPAIQTCGVREVQPTKQLIYCNYYVAIEARF